MKISLFFVSCTAIIVTLGVAVAQNFIYTNQSSVMQTENNTNMNNSTILTNSQSSSSYSYQESNINLSADNLREPHILSIKTSGSKIIGTITVNGKLAVQMNNNQIDINLSKYLSVGNNTVIISGSYLPTSSSVTVKFDAPGTNINQQMSGNGVINSQLNIIIN
ncbi:MAG: hypothetical protein QNJ47_25960 [Nostocaceae cyanobacterium]|nr:hypothetical protein [Nostocaceae cyanobacterium]